MLLVQLSIQDRKYATALAELLRADGSHKVVCTDSPDLGLDGVVVVDASRSESLVLFASRPERFVVIARKDAGLLSRVWEAGVRHVVFEEDGPSTTLLAVIAAELRNPRMRVPALQILEDRAAGKRRSNFPARLTNIHTDRCQSCFPKVRKTHFEVRHHDD
jgi:hypothetical protein